MPKAILEFNLPEEQEEFDTAVNAGKLSGFVFDVEQEVFRPARKHGYSDATIQRLIEGLDTLVEKHAINETAWPKDEYGPLNGTDLVRLLEKLYYDLKNGN